VRAVQAIKEVAEAAAEVLLPQALLVLGAPVAAVWLL
jgi:hypothetical protein